MHGLSDGILGQLQMWVSGSFAVILAAHFAPARLVRVSGSGLAVLYIGYSFFFGNSAMDVEQAEALAQDA